MPLGRRFLVVVICVLSGLVAAATPAAAQDRLCDPGNEDCRTILLELMRNERIGIDVAFWFMEDARYTAELIRRHQAGVSVRVLVDPRANTSTPANADRLAELQAAGIPMRRRTASGILHWKMMLFSGQGRVEFSGANYSSDAWRPGGTPYTNYTDEVIYFTDDPSVVNSFRTKYDDLWTNTSSYANYANISGSLLRLHDSFPRDPELNFPPVESYASRATGRYARETSKIDVIMYRITDRRHTDAIIAARARGIPVRLITEPEQYRDANRLWHSWNVDRLYMAGVKIKHRAHGGLNHQKSVLLYSQRLSIFGSSNWTSPSSSSQEEHNYFTTKPAIFTWLVAQFERKWNNSAGVTENVNFVPLPPDTPKTPSPVHLASGVGTTVRLTWYGGPWAHKYDVYFGTSSAPPLVASNLELGPSEHSAEKQSYSIPTALSPGTTYHWRVVAKTMANVSRSSPIWTFTTTGSAPQPPPAGSAGPGDVVLHAGKATVKSGTWRIVADGSAASAARIGQPNAGAAKVTAAAASPAHYFQMSFTAVAGTPYRLWIRGRAEPNHYSNDSVFVQFSGSVTSSGAATWRIGTASATEVNLEACSGCGISGWGWQDNGWGSTSALGPLVYFAVTGTHTIRVQTREDGFQIDQIVLSRGPFLSTPPGAAKNDTTILAPQAGSTR
jgi:phosphatidylserine/phosphatidylglycerophosphate/cardiolipin synthase-like enzyme